MCDGLLFFDNWLIDEVTIITVARVSMGTTVMFLVLFAHALQTATFEEEKEEFCPRVLRYS